MWCSSSRWLRRVTPATGMIVIVAVAAVTLAGPPAGAHPGLPAGTSVTDSEPTATVGADGAPANPPTQVGTATDWSDLAIGGLVTCGIRTGGTLWCWDNGSNTPTRIGADARWSMVASGWGGTCAIDVSGSLWCWGAVGVGELGDSAATDQPTPTRVGTPGGWITVSVGGRHTCGVRADGSLFCWGARDSGQVGNGNEPPPCGLYPTACINIASTPVRVGDGNHWASVAAGHDHTCALQTDGTVWCWGSNLEGQAGSGKHECYFLPWPIGMICPGGSGPQLEPGQVGSARDWTRVMAGSYFSCGLRATGALWCWGDNTYGQFGEPAEEQGRLQLTPVPAAAGSAWAEVATGETHICAIRTDRALWCWGGNGYGQLGAGSTGQPSPPVQVGAGVRWKKVATNYQRSCAIRVNGTLWCWGGTGSKLIPIEGIRSL